MLPGDVGKWGQHCPHKIAFFFREGRREEGERSGGGREGERRKEGGGGEGGNGKGGRRGGGKGREGGGGRGGKKKGKREEVNVISGDELSGCSVYFQSRFSLHKYLHSHM